MTAGGGFMGFALGLAMLAALVLAASGAGLFVTGKDRQRGLLMIGAALVLVANVLIWAWPAGH